MLCLLYAARSTKAALQSAPSRSALPLGRQSPCRKPRYQFCCAPLVRGHCANADPAQLVLGLIRSQRTSHVSMDRVYRMSLCTTILMVDPIALIISTHEPRPDKFRDSSADVSAS